MSLADKYELESGRIFLSGVQALVRIALDQHRADARDGLRTATFVSGYQGSPLGTFDKELQRLGKLAGEHEIVHSPGLNEELGATAVWGTQLTSSLPGARFDGVNGIWYGKAPGLDRACDAIRHGNFVGTSRTGGVLALVGDDPNSKSSTLPSASEATLAALHVPTLFPGNLQEILDFGRHAFACSRAAGTWVAMKVVTNVADGAGTVLVGPDRVAPAMPTLELDGRPYVHQPSGHLLAPQSLEMERTLFEVRLPLAKLYGRLNGLNRVTVDPSDAWLGVVAAGKAYYDLRQALAGLGLDDRDLQRAGVRILKVGMPFPLDEQVVRDFGRGLDEVLVLEEKRPFLELAVRDALYGSSGSPRVVGKLDEQGRALVPGQGELDADTIARIVAARLGRRAGLEHIAARVAKPRATALPLLAQPRRTAFFCSGCPHNRSTAAPADSAVGVGIGCHTMVLLAPEGRGRLAGLTQMGAEGSQWIGMAPFTETGHFIQNMGDGTFHHSGSLAIRAAVAADVNVTYKLLYNDAVAMTGGQAVQGGLAVPALTKVLELEGVKRIIVTTDDPGRYRGVELAGIAEVRDRGELESSQRELSGVPGVTVLLHDQQCAAEKRRLRKRGKLADPPTRVHINERVCEGCGDCGRKSSCLSVQPVDTEFGRKTRIHQASCNKDYSCLEGDCPSFLTIVPARGAKGASRREAPPVPCELPEPSMRVPADDVTVRMPGVGGTGVVTISQIVGMAALIDGKHSWGLDQTGLSQKGGPVVSDVRISSRPIEGSNKASAGAVDLLLGLDLLGATAPENLASADPARTVAVVSTSAVPTGEMVIDTSVEFPELSASLGALEAVTREQDNVYLDAQALAEALFDDNMPANAIVLGAAYQCGALPLSAAALEQAFRLNGAAVEKNLAAFAWGRACVVAPDAVREITRPPTSEQRELGQRERGLVERARADGELRRLLEVRVPDLIGYQSARLASRYVDVVQAVREAEARSAPDRTQIAGAVARNLHKLMTYKDEYEVARLHLDAAERARARAAFGPGAKVHWHLHPPLLRALGMKRKLKLGPWFTPAFRLLRRLKFLRGTRLDPFGYAHVRRVERRLVVEYELAVSAALEHLTPDTYDTVLELCELPDMVRGYEDVKLAAVERYRPELERLTAALAEDRPRAPRQLLLNAP